MTASAQPLDPARYTTLRRLVQDDQHRLVVSFGGGSMPGICGNTAFAQILEELGLRPSVEEVWGTSAGAVVGGGWATGSDAIRILELTRELGRRGAVDVGLVKLVLSVMASRWPIRRPMPDGVVRGKNFWRTIEAGLAVDTFEQCPTPFRCIAVADDGSMRRKVFRRGPLLPAIFASMSIPGVIVPRPLPDGESYYDGGLVEKTPLLSPIAEHARSGDRRKLLLLCTHFAGESPGPAKGFHNRFLTTLDALENLAWDYQLKEARAREDTQLLLLNPRIQTSGLFDFTKTDEVYLAAREAFAAQLQDAKITQTFGMQ
ncbi:MAG: patatin-like phospholipase family protein [Planctomycetota bacterium]